MDEITGAAWCNTDEQRRNSARACERAFIQRQNGMISRCEYDTERSACQMSHQPIICPPMPPLPPHPPPLPPGPPPPPNQHTPMLTSAKCDAMLRDTTHRFRRMWAAESYAPMGGARRACWEQNRAASRQGRTFWDSTYDDIDPALFFNETWHGAWCKKQNWYEGTSGHWIGAQGMIRHWSGHQRKAALLGFDEDIDKFCHKARHADDGQLWTNVAEGHQIDCIKAGLNILSLFSPRLPYNLCRNLEWQLCAARGELPYSVGEIVFARAPKDLFVRGPHSRLDKCSGWAPPDAPPGGVFGYATEDIFHLEVCVYNQICENRMELFDLDVGEPFYCELSMSRFSELQEILLTPTNYTEPEAEKCTPDRMHRTVMDQSCASWCENQGEWVCENDDCEGCLFC